MLSFFKKKNLPTVIDQKTNISENIQHLQDSLLIYLFHH